MYILKMKRSIKLMRI